MLCCNSHVGGAAVTVDIMGDGEITTSALRAQLALERGVSPATLNNLCSLTPAAMPRR